jgi:hypothetical protein
MSEPGNPAVGSGDTDPADEALAVELAAVMADLRAPDHVVGAAKALFTWRTIDAELAALVFDSLVDEEPVLSRAADRRRQLTFEVGATTIDVELEVTTTGRRLVGQLTPARRAEIELVGASGSAVADELGRFILAIPPQPGAFGLRLRFPDGTSVATAPVQL